MRLPVALLRCAVGALVVTTATPPGIFAVAGPPVSSAPQAARTESDALTGEMARRREYADLLRRKFLLERERQLKELQLVLAETDVPYLLVDMADNQLRIMMRTTVLKSLPLARAEIEGEQEAFSAEAPPPDWVTEIFTLAGKSGPEHEPQALVPRTPDDPPEKVDPRSVTPDQIGMARDPVYPARYTLLFREGLALAIDSGLLGQPDQSWMTRSVERLAAVLIPPERPSLPDASPVRVWIHLGMTPEDAEALYPSLFSDMRAIVRLPGDPRF